MLLSYSNLFLNLLSYNSSIVKKNISEIEQTIVVMGTFAARDRFSGISGLRAMP